MVRPGAWYWTAFVVVSLCCQGTYAVTLKVKPTVVTDQSRAQVILPCEFELDNPNQGYNIRWDRWDKDRDVVIIKDSLDQLFYGNKYTGRVKWGEGCSLVLLSPGVNDTGRYRFNIAAPEDQNKLETAYVQLIVKSEIGETTPGEKGTPKSTGPTPAVTPTEDGGTSPVQGQVVHAAFLAIINSVALVSQTLMMWNSEQNGRTDTLTRLFLGSPVVFFGTGAVTSLISMIMRSNVATIVSFVALTLGIGIDGVFWIIKLKEGVLKKEKKVGEEREEMCLSSTHSNGLTHQ